MANPRWTVAPTGGPAVVIPNRDDALISALALVRPGRPVRLGAPDGRIVIMVEPSMGETCWVGQVV